LAASEFKRRRETYLTQKQAFEALSQQLVVRQNELVQVRYSLEQLPAVMAEKIQALRSELSDVEQRIAETEGRRAYVVRAPVTGRVATLQAVVGRTADPRQLQLSILPDDSMLQAELFVPTRAVGFVRPDQQVRVLYDAFPYQRFGTYEGRVLKVTQTILTSTDIAAPVSLQEPAYKVIVALDRQDITAYGQRVSLQADMLLKADIILERRSLLQWLLDPLLSVRAA
jgi:membrane fusion protein